MNESNKKLAIMSTSNYEKKNTLQLKNLSTH